MLQIHLKKLESTTRKSITRWCFYTRSQCYLHLYL